MLHVYIVIVQVVCIGASLPAKLTCIFYMYEQVHFNNEHEIHVT